MTEFFDNPNVQVILFYLTTLFGATAMYIFSLHQGFEGSVAWLKKMFPSWSQVWYDRIDCIIVIFAGSFIGFISFDPSSHIESLGAGFGWVGAINVLLNKSESASARAPGDG